MQIFKLVINMHQNLVGSLSKTPKKIRV